jgi:glycosyltransferase involved in cell wall biosynthesis
MSIKNVNRSIGLIGHPYAPIGRGEDIRCTYRALRSVTMRSTLTDIYKLIPPDTDELQEFANVCLDKPSDINIFHINGNEVEQSLAHLGATNNWDGFNIVYPAWELSLYPKEWAVQLDRFDEIWAPSMFIKESLETACKKRVIHMPLACEVVLSSFFSRRYFGIPETDYAFLFFFDVRSYATRKNPRAVIESFRKLMKVKPYAKVRLVLKVNGSEIEPGTMKQLHDEVDDMIDHVTIIHQLMTDNETKNLVRCCDCFVSLHRSEGFGRGISEAMGLGKPVIATGYSGNMEFMNSEVSFLVAYNLIPLTEGEYPHYKDQVWADADIGEAAHYMIKLIDDPSLGQAIGKKARLHMKKNFSYGLIGLGYRTRLEKIKELI